jgi:hypothetical protein
MFKIGDVVRTFADGYRTSATGNFPEGHASGVIESIGFDRHNEEAYLIRWSTTPDKVSRMMWLSKELVLLNKVYINNREAIQALISY